jgi:hypothetical protein
VLSGRGLCDRLHDVRSHKMELFVVITLKISDLTCTVDIFESHD